MIEAFFGARTVGTLTIKRRILCGDYMNDKRYARITSQAVMTDFPIGTIINWGSERHLKWGYIDKVEGYVFDGKYWYPAYNTWDGWYEFFGDDEEETYEPLQNSDADLEWLKTL